MEILNTDQASLVDGKVVIKDSNGRMKIELKLKPTPMSPEDMVAMAEEAKLEVLVGTIYCLSERRAELEANLKKANDEVVDLYEAIRKFNAALEEEKGQNVLLTENHHRALARAQDAEALLQEVQMTLFNLSEVLHPFVSTVGLERPSAEDTENVLHQIDKVVRDLYTRIPTKKDPATSTSFTGGPTHID
ncbi:MAG: hypothetical protein A2675_02065 [Candidatus Yonathbacteria bacterium RIFCSPHIGHO2_01_FULL_51_10]|uniref:Uncharacterized protein n=1 Tax=Candidatus Yonathbacteria bacterium RIFCSPHIGHO2_01_FULL_51_10 TaxID=1802723 RepID=A0A1G2SC15_9BACT|nr:MAG: hypothetical protein A2675_02065 [Candidatus Yonathbacteria bacterium RIFCSPHIGHO2_01_FULL_51_10]